MEMQVKRRCKGKVIMKQTEQDEKEAVCKCNERAAKQLSCSHVHDRNARRGGSGEMGMGMEVERWCDC